IAESLADKGYETEGYICICDEEDPPPSGYHLEYPTLELFRDYLWCTDAGSSYNPSTGLLDIRLNVTGQAQMEMRARFDLLGYYGYVINVLSYTLPTFLQDQGHNVASGIIFNSEVFAGESYAGLHTSRLNPADPDWADWLAQYDFMAHMTGSSGEEGDFELGENGSPDADFYRVTVRVRTLVPDA
ncbi:MAG: hypothetical protein NWE89_08355, partial [Candidatus Bathyarchaeota archaeon]|nr:hypothetical protein [Candidatus Bathyarchaeota archaeon]